MREGTEGVIRLQDIRAPVFKILLGFIYSDELPDGTGRGTTYARAARGGGRRRLSSHGPGGGRAAGTRATTPSGRTRPQSQRDRLDVAMVQHLLVAADRFDITRLRAICEARLCEMMEVETAATTLALAEQSRAQALKGACLDFIAANLADVMLTDGYKHMEVSCPQLASELLRTVAMHTTQQQQAAAAAAANAPLAPAAPGMSGSAHSCRPPRLRWREGQLAGTRVGRARVCSRRLEPRRRTTAIRLDSRGPGCRRSLKPRKPPRRLTRMSRPAVEARGTSSMTRPWMSWTRTTRSSPLPRVPEPGREGRRRLRSRMDPPPRAGACAGERRTTTTEQQHARATRRTRCAHDVTTTSL